MMVWNMVSNAITQAFIALEDDELSAVEMIDIIKGGLRSLKFLGVSEIDLGRLDLLTSQYEIDAMDFEEGDALLQIPKGILDELKVQL